jgi:hypothetical protein
MPQLTFEPDGHIYRLDGIVVPSVTQVLERVGVLLDPESQQWRGILDYSFLDPVIREHALFRGRWIHDLAALYMKHGNQLAPALRDRLTAEHPDYMEYFAAVERFLAESGFRPLRVECPVFSVEYGFAGTPDAVGQLNSGAGGCAIIDWKTNEAPDYARFQMAAYEMAIASSWPDYDYRDQPHLRIAVELNRDGSYRMTRPYRNLTHDRTVFLAALTIYKEFALAEDGCRPERASESASRAQRP